MSYDNTNSGALFKNDKGGIEARPDYKGTINVNGVEFWISSWIKTSKAGNKYMSLDVQEKEAVHNQGVQQAQQAAQPAPPQPQQAAPQSQYQHQPPQNPAPPQTAPPQTANQAMTQSNNQPFDDFDDNIPF